MGRRAAWLLVVAVLLAAGLAPILVMVAESLVVEGRPSLDSYARMVSSPRQWTLLGNSLVLAGLTTLTACAVGLPLGVLLGRTDLPFRRGFATLFAIPLLLPAYVISIAWLDLLGHDGVLAHIAGPSVARVSSSWLFGLPGCVLVLFSTFLPIVMLLVMVCLSGVNPRMEEAARLDGGWSTTLRRISIPLILPGILLANLLVFLLTLGEFGVPSFLRHDVFAVESFIQFSAFYDFGAATAAALPLVLITLGALVVERLFLREGTYQLRPTTDARLLIELGAVRRWGFFAAVASLCLVIVVAPLAVLVVQSGSPAAYVEVLARAGDSLLRSLGYAALGASLLTALGFLTGYLIHARAFRFWRALDSLTIFLFALPGTVIGIGLVTLWNRPATNFIYATPLIIVLGYLARYAGLTSRITLSTLAQIPPSMEEAAQIAGAGWFRRLVLIVAPLARRGLVAAWLVAYIFCLRDVGITMIVYPPGGDTFPVRIFTMMANGAPSMIAAMCVVLVLATVLPLLLLRFVLRPVGVVR